MNNVAKLKGPERAELFAETANRMVLSDAIVEKDFWVCWTLKQIFSLDCLEEALLFKGGTSLSKVFQAINRFSEDIDLAVDYARLGFTGDRDPRQAGISKTKQTKILEDMLKACAAYVRTDFLGMLGQRFGEALGEEGWDLTVDEHEPQVVRFRYPSAASPLVYIKPQVILELGTHAEFVPRAKFSIRSFAAAEFPDLFQEPDVVVTALLAKRTFWEKATILHAEFYRDRAKALPARHSRHYYDLALLGQTAIRSDALGDRELLAQVVRHKIVFYSAAWARYDLAVPGSLRLIPPEHRMAELRHDYRQMAVMIFGDPPSFETMLGQLAEIEEAVNKV